MKQLSIIFLVLVFSVTSLCVSAMPGFYSIREIKKQKPGREYMTAGYVVFKYKCPSCSFEDQCKPCMEENFVISEVNKILENYNDVGDKELIIFADKTTGLQLGKKYNFFVSIQESTNNPSGFRAQGGLWWDKGQIPPNLPSTDKLN